MALFLLAVPVWGWVAGALATAGTAAAVAYHNHAKDEAYDEGKSSGTKAGEDIATAKWKEKFDALTSRLRGYHDLEDKLIGMYAVGLAAAAADGEVSETERKEIDEFVAGCMQGHLPVHLQAQIDQLAQQDLGLTEAMKRAAEARVPREDLDDLIDLVMHADGDLHAREKGFITRWRNAATRYDQLLKAA